MSMKCPFCKPEENSLESLTDDRLHCTNCGWQGSQGDLDWLGVSAANDETRDSPAKTAMTTKVYCAIASRFLVKEDSPADAPIDSHSAHQALLTGISAGISMGEGLAFMRLAKAEAGKTKLSPVELRQIELAARYYK